MKEVVSKRVNTRFIAFALVNVDILKKSHFHHTRRNKPKRVTSGESHLRDLAPGNTAPKKRRSGDDTVFNFTDPGIES